MNYLGRSGSHLYFANNSHGVVIDENSNVIVASGALSEVQNYASWEKNPSSEPSQVTQELAHAALSSLDIEVFSSSDRMHTIPKAVVAEAKRGLEWRKEESRGGTPVGLNTARTLADGGQIGIKKIRHIAKYFPRHEVDKKGKGWKPGEDNYPSNGRIAWALWGGDAAWKWASAIVERENKKKSVTAGAPLSSPKAVDLDDFSSDSCQFVVRVRDNGSFDRLYQVKPNGDVFVWDDGSWDSLGNVENDIDTYDRALDDPYDTSEKRHIPIDSQSALTLAALFDGDPFSSYSAGDLNSEEASLFEDAIFDINWHDINGLLAAAPTKKGKSKGDGEYTPEERAENAKKQYRDATGKFAKVGSRIQIGSNPFNTGVLQKIDPGTGLGTVLLDSGDLVEAPVEITRPENPNAQRESTYPEVPPINVEGILGEPQTRDQKYVAKLFEKLPIIGVKDLGEILSGFSQIIQDFRAKTRQEKAVDRMKGEKALEKHSKQSGVPILAAGEEKPKAGDYKSPEESDVKPMYFAIVANDDPQAVMDAIALVPKSDESSEPMTFRRTPGKWERDEKILADLNSPTPPPVVKLEGDVLEDVIKQIDSAVTASMTAAGGLDRNRGNAEKLRRYWLYGKGAAKIRWNTPGDWTRCVRNLTKYMGPRAKGYCALRHKEATGMWTGSKAHRMETSIAASGAEDFNNVEVLSDEQVIENAWNRARYEDAKNRVLTAGGKLKHDGAKFFIPLVIPEGMESGDGRIFDKEAIDIRELPLPLLWQMKTGEGHNGSVVVGRIDHMERTEDGIGNAYGYFDTGEHGKEAERLVRGKFIRGVSADLDKFEASEETAPSENADEPDISTGRIKINKARVMAVTLVPKPAFQECTIQIVEDEQEDEVVPDGVYVDGVDPSEASSLVACGMVAGAIPNEPPADWFENPKLKQATPLTVDEEGRVFGHIAAWHVDHIGMSFGTKPPRSRSGYAYFHTGVVRTAEGKDVPVGQLTLAGGHASLEMSAKEAVRHYDDTASAFADVHAGEDAYGIWVAGALRPGTTPEQIRAIRASAPSGDWRPIKGHLELVAVCQVNVPGFPIARARVASGQVMALVAAGASMLAHMKEDPIAELNARIENLERQPLEMAANDARRRVLAAKAEELAAKVKKTKKQIVEDDISWMTRTFEDGDTESEATIISTELRKRLAKQGKALPDGSFPIRHESDLKNAIQSYGRSKPGDRSMVKKHIVKRAKELGLERLIPETWPEAPKKAAASIDEVPAEGIEFAAGDGPCWEGYEMVGWKEKDGKKVPNCVPVDSSVSEDDVDPFVASLRERAAIVEAMVSAGGLDRNRGNAERLRRYWTRGAGAAKIRWGTPGDWKRCVRYLSKYMGTRAKGYCQLRHKEATGVYTGSRFNPGKNNSVVEFAFSEALYDETPYGVTEVTEDDMMTPVEWIVSETDPDFDMEWEPEEDIILLCMDMDVVDDDGSDFEDTDEYDYDEIDSVFATKEQEVKEIAEDLSPEEIEALKMERLNRARGLKVKQKGRYISGKTQPRDAAGKFRKVLARLKLDLGTAGLDKALNKVEEIENLDFSGDYGKAAKASEDLISIIDRLDKGGLNPEALENVRASSAELGKVIANLPFAFGQDAEKIRFSDIPPNLRSLIEDMIDRVEAKIGKEDADIATRDLKSFMSGNDMYNQSEISAQMAKLLRLLT